tara:strand:+ start:404 stop:1813 length:1410 start_codon:yes stop_codon:yes gene_type:complete
MKNIELDKNESVIGQSSDKAFGKALITPSPLREYQWQGVSFLSSSRSALLADEMGLGKTIQVIVAIRALIKDKQYKKILVVAPSSLCINWENEFHKWAPKLSVCRVQGSSENRKGLFLLPYNIFIASYEQIRSDIDFLIRSITFNIVVLDEAQKIKNPSSAVASACKRLQLDCAWALTGTPIENSVDDLLSVFSFLQPGLLHSALTKKQLHEKIKPYFLRRRRKEVLSELPKIQSQDLLLELAPEQQKTYDKIWWEGRNELRKKQGSYTNAHIFAQINNLKQICNFDSNTLESCKMEALNTIIEGLNESEYKVIVFSQFVKTIHQIDGYLAPNGRVSKYHGSLSPEEKSQIVSDFENNPGPQVLLISLKAGGVGLNLNSATLVILFDRWWNPAVENQAIHRAYRFERKDHLHVIKFLIKNTIEERINTILNHKKDAFEEYIDNAQSADIPSLSSNELMKILGFEEAKDL